MKSAISPRQTSPVDSEFRRPQAELRLQPPPSIRACFPYPIELFRQKDIFAILLLDGGGFWVSTDLLGGAHGSDFVSEFEQRRALARWWGPNGLDWEQLERDWLKQDPVLAEAYAWLIRLYMLPPLAQRAFRSGRSEHANEWWKYFDGWMHYSPPRAVQSLPGQQLKKRLRRRLRSIIPAPWRRAWSRATLGGLHPAHIAWTDMQLSWRLINLSFSLFLLESASLLDTNQLSLIRRVIGEHALRIEQECRSEWAAGTGRGNHFLHKGVSLIHAGVLYPEFERASHWVELGGQIAAKHAREETFDSGANVEASPSYSHFIARLHLDAYRLLQLNGKTSHPGLDEIILQEYAFLNSIAAPDGRTLTINESYSLDAEEDLAIADCFPAHKRARKENQLIDPESRLAVLRRSPMTLFVDGGRAELAHHHQGKPHLVLFHNEQPVLIDSGTCNYDRIECRDSLRRPAAHNTLIFVRNGHFFEPLSPELLFDAQEHSDDLLEITTTQQFRHRFRRFQWQRVVRLQAEGLEIRDRVEMPREFSVQILFHFAPGVRRFPMGPYCDRLIHPSWEGRITVDLDEKASVRPLRAQWKEEKCFDRHNREKNSLALRLETSAPRFTCITTLNFLKMGAAGDER